MPIAADVVAGLATPGEWRLIRGVAAVGVLAGVVGIVGDLRGWWLNLAVIPNLMASVCSFGFGLPTALLVVRHATAPRRRRDTFRALAAQFRVDYRNAVCSAERLWLPYDRGPGQVEVWEHTFGVIDATTVTFDQLPPDAILTVCDEWLGRRANRYRRAPHGNLARLRLVTPSEGAHHLSRVDRALDCYLDTGSGHARHARGIALVMALDELDLWLAEATASPEPVD